MRRLLTRSISDSLIVVYSEGSETVPNGILNHIRDCFHMISMHLDTICECAFTLWYATSRSVLSIRIHFVSHLSIMASVVWMTQSRQKP